MLILIKKFSIRILSCDMKCRPSIVVMKETPLHYLHMLSCFYSIDVLLFHETIQIKHKSIGIIITEAYLVNPVTSRVLTKYFCMRHLKIKRLC